MAKSSGSFKKGEGGRPKGAKNKLTSQTKALMDMTFYLLMQDIRDEFRRLSTFEKVLTMEKMGKFVVGEMKKIESENNNNNSGEMKIIVEYVDDNKPAHVADEDNDDEVSENS